ETASPYPVVTAIMTSRLLAPWGTVPMSEPMSPPDPPAPEAVVPPIAPIKPAPPEPPPAPPAAEAAPAPAPEPPAPEAAEASPEPEAPAKDSNKHWYVVKVQSGREESIKEAIERRVKIEGLEEFFGQIIIPVERVTELRSGKRVVKTRKLYPGYLMCEV